MQNIIDNLQIQNRELKVKVKNRETTIELSKESQKMARKTIVSLETKLEQNKMMQHSIVDLVSLRSQQLTN